MSTVGPPPSDHLLTSSNSIEATELLQKLSLNSPKKSLHVPESAGEKQASTVQYVPVERPVSPFVDASVFYHPSTPFSPDFMDPSMFYNPNGYPSHTYYYGGNEWDKYVGPDASEMTSGVYGEYQHGYSFMPYASYSPSGATMGHDGHLYSAQHYQYPSSHYHSSTTSGPHQPEVSTSFGSNQLQLSADSVKGNSGSVQNTMINQANLSKTRNSTYPNSSMKSSDFYGSGGIPPVTHENYKPSGRNQNPQPLSDTMAFQNTGAALGLERSSYVNKMYPNSKMYGHFENTYGSGPGYVPSSYYPSSNGRGWLTIDNKSKSRIRSNFIYGNNKETADGLNELNKGPRTKGINYENASEQIAMAAKGQKLPSSESNDVNLPVFPDRGQCNKDDFPETYSDARFFVIKSYSEDDVHKSIKYGVWTSTANGNKKLDAAYKDAQEKPAECPVFLLFSVNASGQFVGLAQMVGPVEFDKTVEYWQQDKWNGCFPVKWHIIKDVPNSLLRHITLENNENKPVTNSRDTQEVNFEQGIQVLKIFKSHSSRTCILDDFKFYEGREKVMLDKKARHQQSNKQGAVAIENTGQQMSTGIQPSNGSDDLTLALTKDMISLVSAEPEAAKVIAGPKLLGESSPGARGGDDLNSVQADVEGSK